MKKKEKALSTALANHSSNKENATKQTEKIKSIPKPHGEAGDSSKGGFKLIEAMRLEGKKDLYNQIMVSGAALTSKDLLYTNTACLSDLH